jgi:hypothetical protein
MKKITSALWTALLLCPGLLAGDHSAFSGSFDLADDLPAAAKEGCAGGPAGRHYSATRTSVGWFITVQAPATGGLSPRNSAPLLFAADGTVAARCTDIISGPGAQMRFVFSLTAPGIYILRTGAGNNALHQEVLLHE